MIFVFESDINGKYVTEPSKFSLSYLGAEYGVGEGPTGNCYALPVLDEELNFRDLKDIEKSIVKFLEYSSTSKDIFKVTRIGWGLGGYKVEQIRALFMKYPIADNVVFSKSWFQSYRGTIDRNKNKVVYTPNVPEIGGENF